MRLKKSLPVIAVALLMVLSQGCAAGRLLTKEDEEASRQAEYESSATPTETPTPTATGSDNAPRPVEAGSVISIWNAGSHTPHLAFDAQGQLNLFFQVATTAGAHALNQMQLKPDGTWTAPVLLSPDYQFLLGLATVPDMSGRLCVVWSGEQYDQNGNAVDGLYRNCQQADGTWHVAAQPLARTTGPAGFSAARASDGSLQSVLVTQGRTPGLYYSPIANSASTVLSGTLLSGSKQVLLGRLAIDTNGGFHAAWVETSGGTDIVIQHRYSHDGGKTWSPAEQLYSGSADNPSEISFQLVAGAAGQVHLAWDGDNGVHYRRWSAAGGWEPPVKFSGDARSSGIELAVGPDGLARAAWNVSTRDASVILDQQLPDGTWGQPHAFTVGRALEMALAVGAGGATEMLWNAGDGLRYLVIP